MKYVITISWTLLNTGKIFFPVEDFHTHKIYLKKLR